MHEKKKKPYRVVTVNLYDKERTEIDRITEILRREGWKKPGRSFVVRQALSCLLEELADKNSEQVFVYFLNRLQGTRRP